MAKTRIFLSYAREDEFKVSQLYERLKSCGTNPWMDTKDIRKGADWQASIDDAIRNSDFFLACLSPRSISKAGVLQEEIAAALKKWRQGPRGSVYLIPIRLEQCPMPESLSGLQSADLFELNGWNDLLKSLKTREPIRTGWWFVAVASILLLGAALVLWVKHDNGASQQFISFRPGGRPKTADANLIGVTFWRWNPASIVGSAAISREIVQPKPEPLALKSGMQFYVTFESTRSGYLYVINCERAGGKLGPPWVILPTKRIRGGDNRISAGQVVRLPSADDATPYWAIHISKADYQGDVFTAIVTPEPIPDFVVPDDKVLVNEEKFKKWEEKWRTSARLMFADSRGGPATVTELEVAQDGNHRLGPNDPPPALIYEVSAKPGQPLWVDVPLGLQR